MKKILLNLSATLGIIAATGVVIGIAMVRGGHINVSADTPHTSLVAAVIEHARENAVAARARGIAVPADLSDPERARRGAGNYEAMCAGCHLAPGAANSEIRRGLYPTPPDLSRADGAAQPNAARRFWVIKHGIKASGMPAWAKGGMEDAVIWDLVAFLERLPGLTKAQYREQVGASDGHVHQGMTDHHADDKPAHVDPPGAKLHSH